MLIHPIYVLVITLVILTLIIIESINEKTLLKILLGISFGLVTIAAVATFFYPAIIDNDLLGYFYFGFTILCFVSLIGLFLYLVYKTNNRNRNYQVFLSSLKSSRWNTYLVVGANDKIQEISAAFAQELGVIPEDVIGKKFSDIINQTIRVKSHNEVPMNNNELIKYYQAYAKNVKRDNVLQESLMFLNVDGQSTVFSLITQPIFSSNKYKGRVSIGECKNDSDLLAVEKSLRISDSSLESMKNKFLALLEVTSEGLLFLEGIANDVWLNEPLLVELGLPSNKLTYDEYLSLMDPNDKKAYLKIIDSVDPANNEFSATYRLLLPQGTIWVKQVGKKINLAANAYDIISVITELNCQLYRKIGNELIDNIKDETDLMNDITQLNRYNRSYELAIFKITNLESINNRYSRQVGNLALGKYIENYTKTLTQDTSSVYRLAGLEFAFLITNNQNSTILANKALQINEKMTFGEYNITIEAVCGIASTQDATKQTQDIIIKAYRALNVSLKSDGLQPITFFKDIV